MGSRAPHVLVDTTPAKTIVVYRNGDQFYVGRKFVLSRRRVATFEGLLDQLNEQVAVPFGVRRLFTPTRGRPVRELDALQAGGKYVAAGCEAFKKLDYIHIVPRKPAKMRKLKEIKPVVHCNINVPSRWQTVHRLSRQINVFTNGRLFIPPVKIIIPKFSLMEWNCVLATIGEKVFPLGGVRKLFTMNGHLLDDSKDLQDNHFYVAAGLETFKHFPYWKCPRVPGDVQQKYTDIEKYSRRKKKEDPKAKDPQKHDSSPPKAQDSVFYAKEERKKPKAEPLMRSGADGDVYKAQTPSGETQGAPEVKEDLDMTVEVPEDQKPAETAKEVQAAESDLLGLEGNGEKEDERLYEENERKEDNSRMSFKKKLPLRHNTKKKASHKNLGKNKKVVPFPEKEPNGILEEKNTPLLLETPVEIEDQGGPPTRQQSQEESSPQHPAVNPEKQGSLQQPSLGQPSREQMPDKQGPPGRPSLGQPSREQMPDKQGPPGRPSLGQPSREQMPDKQGPPGRPSLGQPSREQMPDKQGPPGRPSLGQPSREQMPDKQGPPGRPSLGQPSREQMPDKQGPPGRPSLGQPSREQMLDKQGPPGRPSLGQPSREQMPRGEHKEQQTP